MARRISLFILIATLTGCGENGTMVNYGSDCDGYVAPEKSLFIFPYQEGKEFKIRQGNCGQVTHFGQVRFAYDFLMEIGTPILAARSGVVDSIVQSNPDSTGSAAFTAMNRIYLKHADGAISCYLHLTKDSIVLKVGDQVTQGDIIAYSGSSGTAVPHLHFHVYSSPTSWQTMPITFRNSDYGPYALVEGKSYRAGSFEPNGD